MTPADLAKSVVFQRVGQTLTANVCCDTPHGKGCFSTSVALDPIRSAATQKIRDNASRNATRTERQQIDNALEGAAKIVAVRRLFALANGQHSVADSDSELTGWSAGTGFDWGPVAGGAASILGLALGQPEVLLVAPAISTGVSVLTGARKNDPKAVSELKRIALKAAMGDPMANQAIGALKALSPLVNAGVDAKAADEDGTALTAGDLPNGNQPIIVITEA